MTDYPGSEVVAAELLYQYAFCPIYPDYRLLRK